MEVYHEHGLFWRHQYTLRIILIPYQIALSKNKPSFHNETITCFHPQLIHFNPISSKRISLFFLENKFQTYNRSLLWKQMSISHINVCFHFDWISKNIVYWETFWSSSQVKIMLNLYTNNSQLGSSRRCFPAASNFASRLFCGIRNSLNFPLEQFKHGRITHWVVAPTCVRRSQKS